VTRAVPRHPPLPEDVSATAGDDDRITGARSVTLQLVRFSRVLEIVGDILKVQVPQAAGTRATTVKFGDLALIEQAEGDTSLAQVINVNRDVVSLQLFTGTKGVSTRSTVTFLGHPMQVTGQHPGPGLRWHR
jgi:flagellar biosynthesis/type III secretory pathway ATPase